MMRSGVGSRRLWVFVAAPATCQATAHCFRNPLESVAIDANTSEHGTDADRGNPSGFVC